MPSSIPVAATRAPKELSEKEKERLRRREQQTNRGPSSSLQGFLISLDRIKIMLASLYFNKFNIVFLFLEPHY
jgi:hypothetical protein